MPHEPKVGMLEIHTYGSFPYRLERFDARTSGHAHAVARAIRFLADEVLPEAIERDHRLHDQGSKPKEGFDRQRA